MLWFFTYTQFGQNELNNSLALFQPTNLDKADEAMKSSIKTGTELNDRVNARAMNIHFCG